MNRMIPTLVPEEKAFLMRLPPSNLASCPPDIRAGDGVDRFLPARLRPYARLMRLDRPIGTWLLLLPCWWGLALGHARGAAWGEGVRQMALFALGALLMRGAGCVVNDLWDRSFDGRVARTRTRPLPSGQVKPWQAFLFLAFLLLGGLGVLVQFPWGVIELAAASLGLVFFYPLAKRVTFWPQFVLGLAFNWGALVGWQAAQGGLGWPALALYAGGVFWTLAYDTIYAHQDKTDDAALGLKSLALLLGRRTRPVLGVFFAVALALFALALWGAGKGGVLAFACLALAAGHAAWQLSTLRLDDGPNALARFKSNRDFGLLVLLAILAGSL